MSSDDSSLELAEELGLTLKSCFIFPESVLYYLNRHAVRPTRQNLEAYRDQTLGSLISTCRRLFPLPVPIHYLLLVAFALDKANRKRQRHFVIEKVQTPLQYLASYFQEETPMVPQDVFHAVALRIYRHLDIGNQLGYIPDNVMRVTDDLLASFSQQETWQCRCHEQDELSRCLDPKTCYAEIDFYIRLRIGKSHEEAMALIAEHGGAE